MSFPSWTHIPTSTGNRRTHYDEDLEGIDTTFFRPTLRVDNIALMRDFTHRGPKGRMGDGIPAFLGRPLRTTEDTVALMDKCFQYFIKHKMACASIAFPAGLATFKVSDEDAQRLLNKMHEGSEWDDAEREAWSAYILDLTCAACRKYDTPFYLMVGITREVYPQGVYAGRTLFDSVNSMTRYDYLLNTYPDVSFPMAMMSDTNGLELAAAGWLRHNVYPSGFWWYTNQPAEINRETRRRIDSIPRNKVVGCFSDVYFIEGVLPKYNMYRFELSVVLAERVERSEIHPNMEPFTKDEALDLAEDLLVNNPRRLFDL